MKTVTGILDDINHYQSPMLGKEGDEGMPQLEPAPLQRLKGAELVMWRHMYMPNPWKCPASFEAFKCNEVLSASLTINTPSQIAIEEAAQKQKTERNCRGVAAKCVKSPKRRLLRIMRRTLMSWQMPGEKQAIETWCHKSRKSRKILKNVFKSALEVVPILLWWFYHLPLRLLCQWTQNCRAALLKDLAKQTKIENTASAHKFATELLKAVDDDGDGGLSLCELKAAELGPNPMWQKAAIWLTSGRIFQTYDIRGVGVIDEKELFQAMDRFLSESWKYDGVLW